MQNGQLVRLLAIQSVRRRTRVLFRMVSVLVRSSYGSSLASVQRYKRGLLNTRLVASCDTLLPFSEIGTAGSVARNPWSLRMRIPDLCQGRVDLSCSAYRIVSRVNPRHYRCRCHHGGKTATASSEWGARMGLLL